MSPHRPRLARLVSTGAIAVLATACGAAKTTSSNPAPSGLGQLAIRLVDAPPARTSDVVEIGVTITQVTAHTASGGWTTVVRKDPPLRVNLLDLQASALDLGLANLPAGTVTQVRLYVSAAEGANYVALGSDRTTHVPLKVPSGVQSGIKVHGPWEVQECSQTALTLDFDGKSSIWYHPTGHGDEWILRPVIRVKQSDTVPVGCAPDGGAGGGPRQCAVDGDCHTAELCLAGTCAGGDGASCVGASECFSGTCAPDGRCGPGSAGKTCLATADCITGICAAAVAGGSTCAPGPGNTPCGGDADCLSGHCQDATCAPEAGAAPQGTACEGGGDCLSGSCGTITPSICDPSTQGYSCDTTQPCADGLTCTSGVCEPTQRAN